MARICIIPASESNDNSSTTESPTILSLPHPRTSAPTRYLMHPTTGLHELTVIRSASSQPRSWLLTPFPTKSEPESTQWIGNGQIISDGALYIATPIDPLFLLLPHILPSKAHFLPADEIVDSLAEESEGVHWLRVIRVARRQLEARVRAVSESVDVGGGEKAFRVSVDKVISILAKKCGAMARGGLPKSLEDEFVTKPLVRPVTAIVSAATTVTAAAENTEIDGTTKDDPTPPQNPAASEEIIHLLRLRVACRFLSTTYLSPNISSLLSSHLDKIHDFASLDAYLAELKKLRAEAAAARFSDFSLKRSMNDDESADLRADKKRKQEEEAKKKKKNVSKGVRELSKVNTRGMAKLTSFFKKKEAA
ncbi:ribonuclease H2, subunit B [Sphaerosporella brunnea]|uniref:Ribonuclease H2 subunit B n=1 Tax=Sphaerosporella brunnea TaxID=1250544 RepID=A0A5J5F6A2_9PEZI|nr:ribonuclease H2, subunit B [Sphaerosporella brunnea]